MHLSRGARRSVPEKLFGFLLGTRAENYSRARSAAACGCSERSIDRALGCLVFIGAIARQRGGRATSAKLFVLMDMDSFLQHFATLARYVDRTGALSVKTVAPNVKTGALSGESHKEYKDKEKQRVKPPSFEQTQNHREAQQQAYVAARFSPWRGLSAADLAEASRMCQAS